MGRESRRNGFDQRNPLEGEIQFICRLIILECFSSLEPPHLKLSKNVFRFRS